MPWLVFLVGLGIVPLLGSWVGFLFFVVVGCLDWASFGTLFWLMVGVLFGSLIVSTVGSFCSVSYYLGIVFSFSYFSFFGILFSIFSLHCDIFVGIQK